MSPPALTSVVQKWEHENSARTSSVTVHQAPLAPASRSAGTAGCRAGAVRVAYNLVLGPIFRRPIDPTPGGPRR